jgi:hypothetical protein
MAGAVVFIAIGSRARQLICDDRKIITEKIRVPIIKTRERFWDVILNFLIKWIKPNDLGRVVKYSYYYCLKKVE